MSDGLPKKQPAEQTCPRCGDTIIWRQCSQCDGLGEWQFIASSHCGVPQQGKFCSECGATLPAWVEGCAFCAGRGWLAPEHVCSAADQPPPGKPFRVDPATRPAPALVVAAAAPPPVATSAPPPPVSAPAPVVAADATPDAAPSATVMSPAVAVSAPSQPTPGPAAPEPKRNNRMNLWIAILFLLIFALLVASPEITETIRSSFQAIFVR